MLVFVLKGQFKHINVPVKQDELEQGKTHLGRMTHYEKAVRHRKLQYGCGDSYGQITEKGTLWNCQCAVKFSVESEFSHVRGSGRLLKNRQLQYCSRTCAIAAA